MLACACACVCLNMTTLRLYPLCEYDNEWVHSDELTQVDMPLPQVVTKVDLSECRAAPEHPKAGRQLTVTSEGEPLRAVSEPAQGHLVGHVRLQELLRDELLQSHTVHERLEAASQEVVVDR